jgi:EAL domain-containing protein (putative c-di-GMP-specific phosphodiesterase class I)
MFYDDPDKRTGEELLVEADIAMYDAKDAGRNQVVLFDPASPRQAEMTERLCWVDRIREALLEGRFVLHAQPIIPLDCDPRARHELLVRMLSPDGDLIHPPSFLDIAERFELIQEIDRWVVRKGIRLLADRQRTGDDICFEINLSAKSICDPSFPALIEAELLRTGADPSSLVFEVTETAAIVNVEQAKVFAERLAQLGCEFALDDFGSGFASFYYLKHVAFDYVKIDGEFIRDLPGSETSQLVVKSVVDLVRSLGKKTIAEFVQDEDTLSLLRDYGIDYAQGFHIGKPGPLRS